MSPNKIVGICPNCGSRDLAVVLIGEAYANVLEWEYVESGKYYADKKVDELDTFSMEGDGYACNDCGERFSIPEFDIVEEENE